jgi:hypothetical protein
MLGWPEQALLPYKIPSRACENKASGCQAPTLAFMYNSGDAKGKPLVPQNQTALGTQAFQLHGYLHTLYFFSLIWGHSVAASC